MIVDDEPNIVNWLVDLFQSLEDLELEVLKASSGFTALELLDQYKIDIILLDIKMPGLSGLEVADHINRNWPDCRIIFLTGHSDFGLIYEANKKNVTYLLKTEDDSAIIEAVKNAAADLDASHATDELLNQVMLRERFSLHLVKREIIKLILAGWQWETIRERVSWQLQDLKFDTARPVFMIYSKIRWLPPARLDLDMSSQLIRMERMVESILNGRFAVALADIDATTVVCLMQALPDLPPSSVSDFIYLRESLNSIASQWTSAASCYAVLYLYERAIRWQEAGIVYERMVDRSLVQWRTEAFSESYGMVFRDETPDSPPADTSLSAAHLAALSDSLIHSINKGDRQAFRDAFTRLAGQYQNKSNMHHLPTIKIYQSIAQTFIDFILRSQLQDKLSARIRLHHLYSLDSFKSWKDAFHYLEFLAEALFSLIGHEEQNHNERLVGEIRQYIRNHLEDDLSLTSIASQFNYSSSYVSRLFNQTANVSISTYINNVRIEKARELLSQTHESIQEIARRTGFDTPQYFAIVFKKSTGVSPREYRNQFFPE